MGTVLYYREDRALTEGVSAFSQAHFMLAGRPASTSFQTATAAMTAGAAMTAAAASTAASAITAAAAMTAATAMSTLIK